MTEHTPANLAAELRRLAEHDSIYKSYVEGNEVILLAAAEALERLHGYGRGPSREWLQKMADAEDECGSVSVGGLAADVGMLSQPTELEAALTIIKTQHDTIARLRDRVHELEQQHAADQRITALEMALRDEIATSDARAAIARGEKIISNTTPWFDPPPNAEREE